MFEASESGWLGFPSNARTLIWQEPQYGKSHQTQQRQMGTWRLWRVSAFKIENYETMKYTLSLSKSTSMTHAAAPDLGRLPTTEGESLSVPGAVQYAQLRSSWREEYRVSFSSSLSCWNCHHLLNGEIEEKPLVVYDLIFRDILSYLTDFKSLRSVHLFESSRRDYQTAIVDCITLASSPCSPQTSLLGVELHHTF